MSEYEDNQEQEEPKKSVVTVKLEDGSKSSDSQPDAEIYQKSERYDTLVSGLRAELNEKYGVTLFDKCNSVEDIKEMAETFENLKGSTRETPKGVVSLKQSSKDGKSDFMTHEYNSAGDMMSALYQAKDSSDVKTAMEAEKAIYKLHEISQKDRQEFNRVVGGSFLTTEQQMKAMEKSTYPYGKSVREQYISRDGKLIPVELFPMYLKDKERQR